MSNKEFRIDYRDVAITACFYGKVLELTVGEPEIMDFRTIILDKEEATQLRDWLNEALEGMG